MRKERKRRTERSERARITVHRFGIKCQRVKSASRKPWRKEACLIDELLVEERRRLDRLHRKCLFMRTNGRPDCKNRRKEGGWTFVWLG